METLELGEVLSKHRRNIEEINRGDSTSFYRYALEEWKVENNGYSWCHFYFYDDTGTIYKSKLEKYNNIDASQLDNCEIQVTVVGMLPTHSNGEKLVFPN